MPDDLDRASDVEMAQREESIRAAAAVQVQYHPDFDGVNCLDCGGVMPVQRIAMQRVRCVDCQEVIDKYSRRYAR